MDRQVLSEWTVDYGKGPSQITIPHAWRQEVPVYWEGPAIYACTISVSEPSWLLFHGVSYEAAVFIDGFEMGLHRGIWDAFSLPVEPGIHQLEVYVTKNGGTRFPVRDVASGFLPFVYHTFGGIYQPVELISGRKDPLSDELPEPSRYVVQGTRLYTQKSQVVNAQDDARKKAMEWLTSRMEGEKTPQASAIVSDLKNVIRPIYLRGVLTWGWYPELGHTNPPESTIRHEIEQIKLLGFNCVKFCLWVPPHRYLDLLEEMGMHAWLELPLWDPTPDHAKQEEILSELTRIVRQYRHHPNIALWTLGCELHESTSARYRQTLVDMVRELVPGAIVKDNSGSAEMYGGDLREFGDFNDYHPYCELNFYPEVLDSLQNGPRTAKPIFLGEFDDIDVHRKLDKLREEAPYWAAGDEQLNDQGVRWQYDLPRILASNRFAFEPEESRTTTLERASVRKANFIRKYVQEAVRARDDISGYVVSGWRDTPISSSGLVDDWDKLRYTKEDLASWNSERALFLIPSRRPPWIHGGNRVGYLDPFNHFQGRCFWKVGIHSETGHEGALDWDILHFSWVGNQRPSGRVAQGQGDHLVIEALTSTEVGEISWEADHPGGYLLRTQFNGAANTWPIWVVPDWEPELLSGFEASDPQLLLSDLNLKSKSHSLTMLESDSLRLVYLTDIGTTPMPFWRECAYEFSADGFWDTFGILDHWERWLPIATDRSINLESLSEFLPDFGGTSKMTRIDVRTYREDPILMLGESNGKPTIVTTLRPFGGLGNAPRGVTKNPAGAWFLRNLLCKNA